MKRRRADLLFIGMVLTAFIFPLLSGCEIFQEIKKKADIMSGNGASTNFTDGASGLRFTLISSNAGYSVSAATTTVAVIVIPSSWSNLPVTDIGSNAFNGCASLTSIIIPGSVTSIGDYAFNESGLRSVSIPDSVNSIGIGAFIGCSVSSLTIPYGVNNISDSAFQSCFNLKSVSLPDSLSNIGNYAFESCENLSNLVIPDGVTYIGENAFADCISFKNLVIPQGVTAIGNYAFAGWSDYSNIIFSR